MSLLNKLKEYYGDTNVSLTTEGVYKCIKLSDKLIPYQVVYVDFSNKWIDDGLQAYLDLLLSNDYYSSSGYLQWNYYYYFISTEELINEHKEIKKIVENDESFARKFVMHEAQFIEWLHANTDIKTTSIHGITRDLYSVWMSALKESKLHFVYDYSNTNFKKPVEEYIDGIQFQEKELVVEQPEEAHINVDFNRISELKLLKYRKYPIEKNFTFGSVVLINGPNATGKTSFLDSIELLLTGGFSKMAPKVDYELEMIDDKGNVNKYPDANSLYKSRDSSWYKNYMTRGHNLNSNFNRFNYFTSDAAFELKQNDGDENKGLEKIIADIALGREVNKLEERISGFQKRFEEWNIQLTNQIQKLTTDIQQKEQDLLDYRKEIKDPNNYKDHLLTTLKENNWLISSTTNEPDEFIVKVDNTIELISVSINQLEDEGAYSYPYKSINEKISSLEKTKSGISENKDNLFELLQTQQATQKEHEKNLSLKPIVDEISTYYNHEAFESFLGLETDINSKTVTCEHYKRIINDYSSVLITDLFTQLYLETPIEQIDEDISQKRGEVQIQQTELLRQISQLEEGINNLDKIIANIKSFGKEYVKSNPHAENCPLCDSEFGQGNLLVAIEKTKITFTNSQVLSDLKERRQENVNAMTSLDLHYDILEKLKQICLQTRKADPYTLKLSEVFSEVERIQKELTVLNDDLLILSGLKAEFTINNLTEERFAYLQGLLKSNYIDTLFGKSDFESFYVGFHEQLKKSEQSVFDITLKIAENKSLYTKLFTNDIQTEKELSEQLFSFNEAANIFGQINTCVTIDETTSLSSISSGLTQVKSSFTVYKTAYNDAKKFNKAIEILTMDLERSSAEINGIKPRKERARNASITLSGILNENNKNSFLSDYINSNRKEILDVFKLIHSPKEFDDISFESGKISLFSGIEARTLDEISTGQRSALALSIFMSLNKKLDKGPNIILFDDPVTYIDDLNVLSFFDYLRELVLTSKRQIFFVTANQDLAFLFKKKFEFLGDNDFSIIKFKRVDELTGLQSSVLEN